MPAPWPNDAAPIIDPQTLQARRAITDDKQGYSICQRLRQDSRWRLKKQAAIMRKFNDEPPYDQKKLEAAGEGWRRNASTGFLSSMVKRITPAYSQLIDNAQYLTSSRFSGDSVESNPDQAQKEVSFRLEITNTIRGWDDWHTFKEQLIQEDVLMGATCAAWTDEVTWEPRFCRQDDAFFPDGCGQSSNKVPLWCLEQNFQIHEMADYLIDPEASALAGWNIEEVVKAINDATPDNRLSGTTQDIRKYEDVVRESSLGRSYSQGVKVVKTVHMFAQEVNGKVSHYIYNDRGGQLLFKRLDRFNAMDDNIALMAIEVGNGKLYGSKGAGRILYNTHVSIEQARNLITDNLYLSGLLILEQGEDANPQQALTVVHPIAIIGKGFKVSAQSFEINTDAFFAIDRQHTQIAELQIGAFMPGQLTDTSGEKRTASEINYVASIEQQLRQGLLARFNAQFQGIIWQIQKRICSVDNITAAAKIFAQEKQNVVQQFAQGIKNITKSVYDTLAGNVTINIQKAKPNKAVQCCLNLFRKGLTPQEIYDLGQSPSIDLTQDTTQDLSNALEAISTQYANNPNVNQFELIRRNIAAKVGETLADKLVIAQEDNTLQMEAVRLQLMELSLMAQGEQCPVSPRDFDPVHLDVIMQKAQSLFQNPQGVTPQLLPVFQLIVQHAQQHLQQAMQKAAGNTQGLQQYQQFVAMAMKFLGDAQQSIQKMAASPAANGAKPLVQPPRIHGHPPKTHPPIVTPPTVPGAPPVAGQPPQQLDSAALSAQDKPLSRGPVNLSPS